MDFYEAKEKIDSLGRFGSVLGLDNIYNLLERLGNPQDKVNIVHVAGTNGKGSTIAYLSSILTKAGYMVGKYTSPVVFEYLEKYQINGKNISEECFAKLAERVLQAVEEMVNDGQGQPTIFEVETAMAYLYMYESGCDISLIETGMGGDNDATNVCSKVLASVIVSVSLDHTSYLGETLTEIAGHKAGIIKYGCPVVLYGQSAEVEKVVARCAKEKNAHLVISDTKVSVEVPFSYKTFNGIMYEDITPSLKGTHQIKNLCTVLEVVEKLKEQGFIIPKDDVYSGIRETVWHGRFEKISDEPYIVIDGAHNPGAVMELKNTLEKDYDDTDFVFIMGVFADKDFSTEIDMVCHKASKIITVTPDNPRALSASKLAETIKNICKDKDVSVAVSVEEAVKMAVDAYDSMSESCRQSGRRRMILAFGSLSYLRDLTKICLK